MSEQLGGPEQKSTFLDRGTIIALVLVGAVWFAWSKWVEKTYPPQPAAQTTAVSGEQPETPASSSAAGTSVATTSAPGDVSGGTKTENPQQAPATHAPESKLKIETAQWSTELSTWGMALSAIELKEFKTRDDKPILVGGTPEGLFSTYLLDSKQPVVFEVTKVSDTEWLGVSNHAGYKIEKTIKMVQEGRAAGHALHIVTKASGNLDQFPGFKTVVSDEVHAPVSTSFLAPSYDHHDWYVRYEDTNKRSVIKPEKPEPLAYKTALAVALSSHYFTAALADISQVRPDFQAPLLRKEGEKFYAVGALEYRPISKTNEFTVEQTAYVGPKDVDALRAADPGLGKVVDYGMFAVLADPLLWLMRFFHNLFGNWGFAIIGLTLVVRLIVLPFNIYSFKSMKVMQKLQPQIASLKEKYKEDPRRMNEEVMRIMRENKANPVGGCLPMLLQLPVFFALYQVLAQSIELYRQPFIFWIHDLTIKDPFFVLPIIMGVAMYFQQKLTPVADPQQAKILQWMPVIFSFLMFTLPSGLTLYICVSTLFGITQQYLFMRDKSAAQSSNNVHAAKA